jgi:hypothetical protein
VIKLILGYIGQISFLIKNTVIRNSLVKYYKNNLTGMDEKEFPVEDVKNKINDILSEPEIRFCGLIDSSGQLVAGDFGNDVIPFENDERRRQMFQELAYRVSNRKGFDANLGRVKYSSSRREKVVMMSFPIGTHIILVIAESNVNIDRLGWKILNKLGRQWSEYDGI